VEFSYLDNLKGMKLIYTLFFLLSALIISAQNDTIYPSKKIYNVGDTIELIFKSKPGSMTLASNGACQPQLMYYQQTLKSTGWPKADYILSADACGLPYYIVPNGKKKFYPLNYAGTFRMVFFKNGKPLITGEFTVTSDVNDTIYPTKKTYKVGETIELVFKSKTGAMQLSTNGACNAQLLYVTQTLKPTGWPEVYVPEQLDCGLAYIQIPNGVKSFFQTNYTGTFRFVLFSEQGVIFTDEFTVE
jgi:hypothetical protein